MYFIIHAFSQKLSKHTKTPFSFYQIMICLNQYLLLRWDAEPRDKLVLDFYVLGQVPNKVHLS